ncbi:MAG: hypothetical protein PHY66_05815 [Aliarcobacter sp.]|nr:hypothetical protein [Aliarcobacter sp.]
MNEQEILAKILADKYGKIALNEEETAIIIGCSKKALEEDRRKAIGIPFSRRTGKERGQVMYTITAIAKHLINNQIKTLS